MLVRVSSLLAKNSSILTTELLSGVGERFLLKRRLCLLPKRRRFTLFLLLETTCLDFKHKKQYDFSTAFYLSSCDLLLALKQSEDA